MVVFCRDMCGSWGCVGRVNVSGASVSVVLPGFALCVLRSGTPSMLLLSYVFVHMWEWGTFFTVLCVRLYVGSGYGSRVVEFYFYSPPFQRGCFGNPRVIASNRPRAAGDFACAVRSAVCVCV